MIEVKELTGNDIKTSVKGLLSNVKKIKENMTIIKKRNGRYKEDRSKWNFYG